MDRQKYFTVTLADFLNFPPGKNNFVGIFFLLRDHNVSFGVRYVSETRFSKTAFLKKKYRSRVSDRRIETEAVWTYCREVYSW